MASVIDKAIEHFASFGQQHMDVEEWGEPGSPLRVFWTPMTMRERNKHFAGDHAPGDRFIRLIIDKLTDKDGKKLFSLDDFEKLRTKVDPVVIVRIGVKITDEIKAADAEKN
jgi:hypothetical protein